MNVHRQKAKQRLLSVHIQKIVSVLFGKALEIGAGYW